MPRDSKSTYRRILETDGLLDTYKSRYQLAQKLMGYLGKDQHQGIITHETKHLLQGQKKSGISRKN